MERTYTSDLVSVVIPTYNYCNIISETLESVLSQTYFNLEIIVTDDGSTDGTQDIILDYAKRDKRVIPVLSPVNQGFSSNMNKGFERCTGEFIAKLDGDDLMLPNKIEKQVNFLKQNPEYVLCLSDMEVFDSTTGIKIRNLSDEAPLTQKPQDWCLFTNWFFLRKTPSFVYSSALGRATYLLQTVWDVRVPLHNENLHLIGNYALNPEGKWYTFSEVLGKYRFSPTSMSKTKRGPTVFLEEAFVSYGIAAAKYPQIANEIKSRRDFLLFTHLLYGWEPKENLKRYERLFYLEAGIVKFLYLKTCKLLLKARLLSIVTAPGRYLYKKLLKQAYFKSEQALS